MGSHGGRPVVSVERIPIVMHGLGRKLREQCEAVRRGFLGHRAGEREIVPGTLRGDARHRLLRNKLVEVEVHGVVDRVDHNRGVPLFVGENRCAVFARLRHRPATELAGVRIRHTVLPPRGCGRQLILVGTADPRGQRFPEEGRVAFSVRHRGVAQTDIVPPHEGGALFVAHELVGDLPAFVEGQEKMVGGKVRNVFRHFTAVVGRFDAPLHPGRVRCVTVHGQHVRRCVDDQRHVVRFARTVVQFDAWRLDAVPVRLGVELVSLQFQPPRRLDKRHLDGMAFIGARVGVDVAERCRRRRGLLDLVGRGKTGRVGHVLLLANL